MIGIGDIKELGEIIFGSQENLSVVRKVLRVLMVLLTFSGFIWGSFFASPSIPKGFKAVVASTSAIFGMCLIFLEPRIALKLMSQDELTKFSILAVIVGLATGLLMYGVAGFKKDKPKDTGIIFDASGGKGGDALAKGDRSVAIGGRGGAGGVFPGMPGMDAVAEGNKTLSIGGDGGNAPTWDGVGGKGARSPVQNMGLPTSLWGSGIGGRGANNPEATRRLRLLVSIRNEYLKMFPQDALTVEAGIEDVELIWVNKRLEELGENWRVLPRNGVAYCLPALGSVLR